MKKSCSLTNHYCNMPNPRAFLVQKNVTHQGFEELFPNHQLQ